MSNAALTETLHLPRERQHGSQLFPWPADGEEIENKTPALRWIPLDDAAPYEVTVTDSSGAVVFQRSSALHYCIVDTALEPGAYQWDVRSTVNGASRGEQRFSVAADARTLLPPTAAAILSQLPEERPRHIFFAENITETLTAHQEQLTILRRNMALALADGLPPAPRFHMDPNALPYREAFGQHRQFIDRNLVACALGHLLLNDEAATAHARSCLLHVCSWNPEGPCSVQGKWGDEFGLSHARCLPAVYDWCHDVCDERERDFIERTLAQYGRQVEERLLQLNFALNPADSHAGRLPAYLGEIAMVLYGSKAVNTETCERWLNYALEIYTAIFPFYGGRDGGWAEGPFYASSYTKWYQPFFFAIEQCCGYSFFEQQPFYRNAAHFFLHCGQPQWECRPFGDGYWCTPDDPEWPGFCAQDPFGVYAERFGPEVARTLSKLQKPDHYNLHLLDVFRPPLHKKMYKQADPAANSRLFRDAGYVSMHKDISDFDNDVALLAIAGRYGGGSHRHADQGNVAIIAGGKQLIGPSGYFGRKFGSDHHRLWTQQTQAHNCILVDGQGQNRDDHRACGRIHDLSDDGTTASCGIDLHACYPMLKRYLRQLTFDRRQMQIQIIDVIEANDDVRISWLLHSLSAPALQGGSLRIERGSYAMQLRLSCDTTPVPVPHLSDQWGVHLNQGEPAAYHVQRPLQHHLRWDFEPAQRLCIQASISIEALL